MLDKEIRQDMHMKYINKSKILFSVCSLIMVIAILFGMANTTFALPAYDKDVVVSTTEGIIEHEMKLSKSATIQDYVDYMALNPASGSNELNIVSLNRLYDDINNDLYADALCKALLEDEHSSSASLCKGAIALMYVRDDYTEDDLKLLDEIYNKLTPDNGIMNDVYAINFLNQYTNVTNEKYDIQGYVQSIYKMQNDDGGFGIIKGSSDVDVTCFTLRALYDAGADEEVINRGLEYIRSKQYDNGVYASLDSPNLESTAQVLITLVYLDEDFINEYNHGDNVLNAMMTYKLDDGSFTHNTDTYNEIATSQALEAMSDICYVDNLDVEKIVVKTTNWNLIIRLIIIAVIVIAAAIIILTNKKKKTRFMVAGVAIVLIAGAALMQIQSPQKYKEDATKVEGETISITISIDASNVRNDGVIVPETEIEISEDSTAFDAVKYITALNDVQMEYKQSLSDPNMIYVEGIDELYEFQFGDLSGWMFMVNGELSDVGAGRYVLSDGDDVKWIYTTEIGKDIEVD
jgi:hypothetical protein